MSVLINTKLLKLNDDATSVCYTTVLKFVVIAVTYTVSKECAQKQHKCNTRH